MFRRALRWTRARPYVPGIVGSPRPSLEPHGTSPNLPQKSSATGKPFNKLLMTKWHRGKLTCQDVLEFACAAEKQGMPDAGRLAMSDLRNASRNLISAIGYPEKAPPIKIIELPGLKPGSKLHLPIICPIDSLEAMISHNPARFEKTVLGEPGNIPLVWLHLKHHVLYVKNKDFIDPDKSILVKTHADAAPTTKVDGLMTISWSSCHGRGSTRETRNVFAVLPKKWTGTQTLDALLSRYAWAMNALVDGVLPMVSWEGRPNEDGGRQLARGWRLAPILAVTDWDFLSSVCGFPTGQSVPEMCWICCASPSGRCGFCNVDRNAEWRSTYKTHESYLASCAAKGKEPCTLMLIKVLRLEGFLPDAMHGMDEGFTSEVAGNVLFECMESPGYGSNQADRAAKMDTELKAYYKAVKETVKIDGRLTFTRVKESSEYPVLKAKAAATRHIVPFLVILAERHNTHSVHDQRRLAVCKCLDRAYKIMEAAGTFLEERDKAELKELSMVMMSCYRNLSLEAAANSERKWKMKPKLHETQHILEDFTWINPRHVWLYADEDLQRIIKLIAVQCHPSAVPYMTLFRWVIGAFGEFEID